MRKSRLNRSLARDGFVESLESRLLFVAPGTPANPNPINNLVTNPMPSIFTWTATPNTQNYDVKLDGVTQTTVTTNSWAHPAFTVGAHTWQIVSRNTGTGETTAGPVWNFTLFRPAGYDLSSNQGSANFATAYSQGIRFAFVRASRTTFAGAQDSRVTTFVPGAKAANILVGVYYRVLPKGENEAGTFTDPIVDADQFLATGGAYMGTGYMRPVVDVEDGETLNTTPINGYNLKTWVVAFINRIKQMKPGVNPLVYTGSAFSGSYLDSTTVNASPDLWIANWTADTDPRATNVDPHYPTSGTTVGTGPWRTAGKEWDFWQYDSPNGLGSQYGVGSGDIDLDVFHGTNADHSNDYSLLKQNFVIGAPTIPTIVSPSNGATNVPPTNLTLDWNSTGTIAGYDVYLDNNLIATNIVPSQYTISSVAGGAHTWRIVAKGVISDDDTHVSSPTWSFTAAALPLPGVPGNPNHNGDIVNSHPVTLTWSAASNATSYDVYLGTNPTPTANVTTPSYGPITPTDGIRMWRVVAKNSTGSTNGPQWQYTMDKTAPDAAYAAPVPVYNATYVDFTITYSDATTLVDISSLDENDITVTSLNYSANATFVGIDTPGNGSTRIATYRLAAPGGTWEPSDNGQYTVKMNASQVKDTAGNFRAAGDMGTFVVNFTPFAHMDGSLLHLDFDGTTTPLALSHASGTYSVMKGTTTLNFNGVTAISADGTSLVDLLNIASGIPVPFTFNGYTGNDELTLQSGSVGFDSDLGATGPNLHVKVNLGASALFNSTQHLRGLTVDGNAAVAAGGDKVIVTHSLAISGKLDLSDNDLLLKYTSASPIGTWNGAAYDGISGMIASGNNGGAWDGPGLVTTQSAALSNLTTLGVAEAADALGLMPGDTALFDGETVDAATVIVKYTYGGDANIDGVINADDYATIDFNSNNPAAHNYFNGDFNLDGVINADDYSVIDFNNTAQGSPL